MRFLCSVSLFLWLAPLVGRSQGMIQTTRDRVNFSGLAVPSTGTLFGVSGEAGQVIGDGYLDTTFQAGIVRFYKPIVPGADSLRGIPVRYDLLNNEVEIKAGPRDLRAARGETVRSFTINNPRGGTSHYVNIRDFTGELPEKGFFDVLAAGRLGLLQHPYTFVKRGNYNSALNVGSKDDEIQKRFTYYVLRGQAVEKFSPGRKALLTLMADKRAEVEAFLKQNDPDLKSVEGLAGVFAYYNSL